MARPKRPAACPACRTPGGLATPGTQMRCGACHCGYEVPDDWKYWRGRADKAEKAIRNATARADASDGMDELDFFLKELDGS